MAGSINRFPFYRVAYERYLFTVINISVSQLRLSISY